MTQLPAMASDSPKADVVRTVFLATPVDLQSNGIGALFLNDLLASQPDIAFTIHSEPSFLMGAAEATGPAIARLLQAASTRLPGFHSARLRAFRSFALDGRVAAIAAAADTAKAECLWVTASSPEMIWIAEQLAASGRDLRVTVWDAPEYFSRNLNLDTRLHDTLMQSFGTLLKQVRSVSVIGHTMQADYQARYGVKSEIIRHGIHADMAVVGRAPSADGPVRIIFAGSLYSKGEWNAFVAALEGGGWQVAGRPVLLYFIGRFPLTGVQKPEPLILLGERPFDEALRIMSTMDIGYLPYWFDQRHEFVARTSFPGKLSAYAAAGLAVFHHAPPYTEATGFLGDYPFGLACPSLQSNDIVPALARLLELTGAGEGRAARVTAVREELSREAMAARFQRFLARRPA